MVAVSGARHPAGKYQERMRPVGVAPQELRYGFTGEGAVHDDGLLRRLCGFARVPLEVAAVVVRRDKLRLIPHPTHRLQLLRMKIEMKSQGRKWEEKNILTWPAQKERTDRFSLRSHKMTSPLPYPISNYKVERRTLLISSLGNEKWAIRTRKNKGRIERRKNAREFFSKNVREVQKFATGWKSDFWRKIRQPAFFFSNHIDSLWSSSHRSSLIFDHFWMYSNVKSRSF